MQDQLNRIRNKDYSQIDQKLFNTLGNTNQLDHTLAQLAQLQKYLKQQIQQIGDQKQKQAAMKASQIVMNMNIVHQSKISKTQYKCKQQFMNVLQKIKKVNKILRNIKQVINRQIKNCIDDYSQIINSNFAYMVSLLSRKNNQIKNLKFQVQCYKQQTADLKNNNQQLQNKLLQWEQAQQRIKQRMGKEKIQRKQHENKIIHINTENQHSYVQDVRTNVQDFMRAKSDRNLQAFYKPQIVNQVCLKTVHTFEGDHCTQINQAPKIPMPLRRQTSTNKKYQNSIQKYTTNDNNRRTIVRYANTNNCTPLIQIADNKYFSKPVSPNSKNRQKQSQILKLKGTQNINRKSTKKLKLFSLI